MLHDRTLKNAHMGVILFIWMERTAGFAEGSASMMRKIETRKNMYRFQVVHKLMRSTLTLDADLLASSYMLQDEQGEEQTILEKVLISLQEFCHVSL